MIGKNSRYQNSIAFVGEQGKQPQFLGLRPRKIKAAAGVLEYTIKEGDRLDLLSHHFYNNTQRWWRILDANPQIIFGGDLMLKSYVGETILIPRSIET